MDEKLQIENVPFDVEPLRTNRYIVDLSEYEIPQWVVSNVYFDDDKNLILDIIEIVGGVYAKKLNNRKISELKIQLLDPTNAPVMDIVVKKLKIKKIIPCELKYESDDFLKIKVIGSYKKIIYK